MQIGSRTVGNNYYKQPSQLTKFSFNIEKFKKRILLNLVFDYKTYYYKHVM